MGDTKEIIKRERIGIIVDEFSDAAYKEAGKNLMELLSEGERLRKRCRAAAEKYFSLDSGVEKYWNIYRRLT